MKKTIAPLFASLAIAATAQAGEDYSAKAMPPAPEPCLWTWFAGGGAGYVDDIDTGMYTLHVGKEYKCPTSSASHAIYLEVGYANWDDDDDFPDSGSSGEEEIFDNYEFDFDIVPITINYKYENQLWNKLNWYIGGGIGIAISSIDWEREGRQTFGDDDTETNFYGHVFAGLVYNFTESFEMFAGARYLYMDGNDEADGDIDISDVLDDDMYYELGLRFNF